jgi:hypothetical protein
MLCLTDKHMVDIDRVTFRWHNLTNDSSPVYKPVVWKHCDLYYQLNYFDDTDNYILNNTFTPVEALKFTINFYRIEISLLHLSRIYTVCQKFHIMPEDLEIFEKHGIKGKIAFGALLFLVTLNSTLTSYIVEKKIGIKYLTIMSRLMPNHLSVLEEFVIQKRPSVGEFRNFLHFLKDYENYINVNQFNEDLFNEIKKARNPIEQSFYDKFTEIKKSFKTISVDSPTNFERSALNIAFQCSTIEEYENALEEISQKDRFETMFELMKEYDIG